MNFKELSEKDYRTYPCESYSSIKYLLEDNPIQTYEYHKNNPFKGNDSTLLGTCVHHYLQGNRHLVTFNHIKRVSKVKKEEYAEFEKNFKELAGEDGIIAPASFEPSIDAIMKNFNENKLAVELMKDAIIEEPFLFTYNGIELKGKPDALKDVKVTEIKTSSKATNKYEFKQEALDRNYDLQAYLYLRATRKSEHYFIVANTVSPFSVTVYKSSEEFIESGRKKALIVTHRYLTHIINKVPYNADPTTEEI